MRRAPSAPWRGQRDGARLEIGVERHLRVDGDRLVAGQADDHVGAAGSGIRGDRGLRVEVDVAGEARGLDDPSQLGLAPDAARAARAQRAGERLGGRAERLVGLLRLPQLLGERAELRVPIALEIVDLGLHGLQRLVHRRERAQHRLLAALALFARRLVGARLRGQLAVEQLLVVELRLHALPGRPRWRRAARAALRDAAARAGGRAGAAGDPAGEQPGGEASDHDAARR